LFAEYGKDNRRGNYEPNEEQKAIKEIWATKGVVEFCRREDFLASLVSTPLLYSG